MKKVSFGKLFAEYDCARAQAKEADKAKTELADEIKSRLEAEKLDAVDEVDFLCVYKYEKDKEIEVFDEEKFAEKEPKKYADYQQMQEDMKRLAKKYTKKSIQKGARKLIVTRKNEGEE